MTEEILLTEELFLEFLDPVSAKAYTWKQETESGYASLKFQASFEDDHEKRYYLSFYRDTTFGKNSRRVIFSVKKNKNLNPKIHVDKGSFIKILGTIIQIYQYYKLNDPDGKMSNSYGFQFPDTFAKYMPFLAKVIKRLFKTTPKIRLELYGAVESLDGNTIIYLANTSTSLPLFGGPKADLALIRGEFYMKLTGQTASDKEDEGSEIQGVPPVPKAPAPYMPPAYEPTPVKKASAKATPKYVPSPKPAPEPEAPVGFVPSEYNATIMFFTPDGEWAEFVYAKEDSGSSSFIKGDKAEIFAIYNKGTFEKIKEQFKMNPKGADKIISDVGDYVLILKTNSGKFVGYSIKGAAAGNINFLDPRFEFIKDANSVPVVVKKAIAQNQAASAAKKAVELPVTKADLDQVAKNPYAISIDNLPESYQKILDDASFNLGPIKVRLGEDTSIIGVVDKLEEVRAFFGTLPKDQLKEKMYDISGEVEKVTSKLVKSINTFLEQSEAFLGQKDGHSTGYINSVKIYTGSGYEAINNFLRGKSTGVSSSSQIEERVKSIDEAFSTEGIYLPSKLVVYRGASISIDQIEDMNNMKSVPLTGYASVSLRPATAISFMSGGVSFVELGKATTLKDVSDPNQLDQAYYSSSQGNKILYSINRLDRCLSLALKKISNHPNEEEILLNRGVTVRPRPGKAIQRVMKRETGSSADNGEGIWLARVEIAPKAISESSLALFLLREAIDKFTEAQDALAITQVFLDDYAEFHNLK
jgi:hypothetical protein